MYSFPSSKFNPKLHVALISGVGRSGKTTLGNILATGSAVEYSDEPWPLHIASVMVALKVLSREAGKGMFSAYLSELANDMVLMRQANFRPEDLSTIWTKKDSKEIFSRLVHLNTREEVKKFISKNKSLFLLAFSADPGVNLPVLTEFLPHSKMMYVVRRGIDVAYQVEGKKWFSTVQLHKPFHAQMYRPYTYKGKKWFFPCWLPKGQEKEFLGYNEFERGLFYWCTLVEASIKELNKLKKSKRALVIKFEDLLANPQQLVKKAEQFLRIKPTRLTKEAIKEVTELSLPQKSAPKIQKALLIRTRALYQYFGYDWK